MVAGKTEGTMKIESVGRTWVADLLDRIGVLLRRIAPGFVALFAWAVVVAPEDPPCGRVAKEGYEVWALAAGAALCGILIYALHRCVIARVLWRPVLMRFHLSKGERSWITPAQRKLGKADMGRLLLELDVERLRRRISEDTETKAVQKGLDRWRAIQSFLYCSSYAMIIVSLLAKCPKAPLTTTDWEDYVLLLGAVTLVAALISNSQHIWRDLWAASAYRQGKTPKAPARRRKKG